MCTYRGTSYDKLPTVPCSEVSGYLYPYLYPYLYLDLASPLGGQGAPRFPAAFDSFFTSHGSILLSHGHTSLSGATRGQRGVSLPLFSRAGSLFLSSLSC